jgi:hypothetical protein
VIPNEKRRLMRQSEQPEEPSGTNDGTIYGVDGVYGVTGIYGDPAPEANVESVSRDREDS